MDCLGGKELLAVNRDTCKAVGRFEKPVVRKAHSPNDWTNSGSE
jgi:hypothetical protein